MIRLVAHWFLSALALLLVSRIYPGVRLEGFGSALVAALVIGLLNALIRPLLFLLTLPITFLTLGLFTFVINAFLFSLAGRMVGGFHVDGFGGALIGSILLTVISTILHRLVQR